VLKPALKSGSGARETVEVMEGKMRSSSQRERCPGGCGVLLRVLPDS
jgi:hypothetical protein